MKTTDEARRVEGARVLRARDAAAYLGLAMQTMARWRVEGRGPRFTKFGGAVVYQLRELDQFIERNTHSSTSAAAAAPSNPANSGGA
jgi:predicted DNA-binding transcriptional regulator AlpA